jgi:hypothetical protein
MPVFEIAVRLPNGIESSRKMNAESLDAAVAALTDIGFDVVEPGTPEPVKVDEPGTSEPVKVEDKPKRAKKD